MKHSRTFTYVFFLAFIVGLLVPLAFAYGALNIIFTWQASNFYPSNYVGKAAATINTPVTVSIVVTQDGKVIDISNATITWYVDGRFFNRDKGLGEIGFQVNKLRGDEYFVRIVVDFGGDERVEGFIIIPILAQHAVINAPYPNKLVRQGEQTILQIIPFFFNVLSFDDFLFSWDINNQNQPSQEKDIFIVSVGSSPSLVETKVSVSATVSNKRDLIETVKSLIRLTIY